MKTPPRETNPVDLDYRLTGQGPLLVFIHGLGSSGEDWRPQIDYFSARCTVLTMDLRGHGASPKPPGRYSIAQMAADLSRLADRLGLGPGVVVGLSMGGAAALQLALDRPDLVRAAVVINSGPTFQPTTIAERAAVAVRRLLLGLLSLKTTGRLLAGRLFPGPEHEFLRAQFIDKWATNHKPSYRASFEAVIRFNILDRLAELSVPTLYLASEFDYTPFSRKRDWAGLSPLAEAVMVPRTRHALPREAPEVFNAALDEFLNRLNY